MNDTLAEKIRKFDYKLSNAKGHSHLYGLFDEIVAGCQQGQANDREVQRELYAAIDTLIFEATMFYNGFPFYPSYVIRCYECACQLKEYLTNEYEIKIIDGKLKTLLCNFKNSPLVEYMPSKLFNECMNTSDAAETLEVIERLFQSSDCGRRPHVIEDEVMLHSNFMRGYELCQNYLESTRDYDSYQKWFRILDPIHVGNILAAMPEDHIYDRLGDMIDEVLTLQIEMLEDWKEHSFESFREFGGLELLEKLYTY